MNSNITDGESSKQSHLKWLENKERQLKGMDEVFMSMLSGLEYNSNEAVIGQKVPLRY